MFLWPKSNFWVLALHLYVCVYIEHEDMSARTHSGQKRVWYSPGAGDKSSYEPPNQPTGTLGNGVFCKCVVLTIELPFHAYTLSLHSDETLLPPLSNPNPTLIYHLFLVLVSSHCVVCVLSIWYKPTHISENRTSMRNCLPKTVLWTCLWGAFLIGEDLAHYGSAIPRQVILV